ncbi:MAG TPA: RebB family R body protein [Skermanella sp.]|jgi:hypothetical protein|nr:RebB family R body protein [Skermanella sp.]
MSQEIVSAVAAANLKTVAESPAFSMAVLCQFTAQSSGLAMQNAVIATNEANHLYHAANAAMVEQMVANANTLSGLSSSVAADKIMISSAAASQTANLSTTMGNGINAVSNGSSVGMAGVSGVANAGTAAMTGVMDVGNTGTAGVSTAGIAAVAGAGAAGAAAVTGVNAAGSAAVTAISELGQAVQAAGISAEAVEAIAICIAEALIKVFGKS